MLCIGENKGSTMKVGPYIDIEFPTRNLLLKYKFTRKVFKGAHLTL